MAFRYSRIKKSLWLMGIICLLGCPGCNPDSVSSQQGGEPVMENVSTGIGVDSKRVLPLVSIGYVILSQTESDDSDFMRKYMDRRAFGENPAPAQGRVSLVELRSSKNHPNLSENIWVWVSPIAGEVDLSGSYLVPTQLMQKGTDKTSDYVASGRIVAGRREGEFVVIASRLEKPALPQNLDTPWPP
jgi:hypothetical protein